MIVFLQGEERGEEKVNRDQITPILLACAAPLVRR